MNNLEYIQNELGKHYPDKTIFISKPKNELNGCYFLDIDHVEVQWFSGKPLEFGLSAAFHFYYGQNGPDLFFTNVNLDSFVDKIIGFVDNKLVSTVEYKVTPDEYRERFYNAKETEAE